MARRAKSLPPAQLEGAAGTPSRKRRKIMEVAASDTPSSVDPISPGRHPNSTPRRLLIRPGTPLSDSRRRSAPTSLFSPLKPGSQRETRERADRRQTMLKEEKKDSSPAWLIAGVNSLHSKYPNDSFKAENGAIICMDCGRPFKPSANGSVSNFETHLRSKTHRNTATERMEKLGSTDFVPQNYFLPGGMDFTIPPQPLTVFAHKGQQSVESARSQYFSALEREICEKAIRATLVEGRLMNAEKTNKERFDQIDASLEANEKSISEKLEEMSEVVTSSEERCKEQVQEVKERLASSESRSKDEQDQFIDMVARLTSTEEKCNSRLDEMIGRLARSDHRNIDQLEKLQERFDESEQEASNRLQKFQETSVHLNSLTSLLEDSEKLLELKLEKFSQSSKEHVDQLSERITASELEGKDRLQNSEQNLEVSIYSLKLQLEQAEQASKEQILELSQRVNASEETLKVQEGIIDDLESKSQLYAEEIQRSRESEESFRKAMADQMQAHFEQTAKRTTLLEAQSAERVKGIEMMIVEWMKGSEKKIKETEKMMKRLTEDNKYQEEVIEKVIPALMQEMQEMKEYSLDFETRLAAVTRVKEESHESPFMFSKVKRSPIG